MNMLRTALLIARRDYRERVRGRTFLLATILVVVLSAGGVIAADKGKGWFGGTETHTIGVINPPDELAPALQRAGDAFDMHIKTREFADDAAANAALDDGKVDAVLAGTEQLRFKDSENTDLSNAVSQAVATVKVSEQLRSAGLSPSVWRASRPPIGPAGGRRYQFRLLHQEPEIIWILMSVALRRPPGPPIRRLIVNFPLFSPNPLAVFT